MELTQKYLPFIFELIEKGDTIQRSGKLIAINDYEIEMPIKRLFYLYDFNKDKNMNKRGCHAHKTTTQILIMVHGAVEINTKHIYTKEECSFTLNSPNIALQLPPNNFIDLVNFTEDAVLIVLCDETYENDTYIQLEDLDLL